MGAANCCKKPTEVVVIEEIKNTDGEKINGLEHDSIPQDTEFVHKDDIYQQEVSNQMLYEQELSPQIGGAYEVQIKESTPEQNNDQINEDFQNYNNIQPAEFQNQNQEELKQYNLINENPNININDINDINNQNQPEETNNIPNAEQNNEQIKQNEEEDLNKYFQIPPGNYNNINNNINVLEKSKTTNINDLDMEQIQKLIEQHQNQTQTQNQQQPINNINIKEIPDQNQNLPQAFDINNIMNQNPNQNAATTTTTTTTTKTVVENTPIDLKQFGLGLENITVPSKQMTMPIQSQEEDYSKYFEQPAVTTQQISNPVNINNLVTPNITQGTTTTNFNYVVNQPILTKVNTTPANAAMTSLNPQINYGLNNAQQQQKTVVTTTQSTGIPTQNYFTQSYTLPANYAQNKTTTTQVVKTVGPTQVLQYSNTMPVNVVQKYN